MHLRERIFFYKDILTYPATDNTIHIVKFMNNIQFNFGPAILADVHAHPSTQSKSDSWVFLIGSCEKV